MKTEENPRFWHPFSNYEKALCIVFLLSLPFLHATVNGDGLGYYGYLRSLLIDHNLQFSSDFQHPEVEIEKIFLNDHFVVNPITKTGHLPNFYSVGPAILWSPFILVTHVAVLGLGHFGWHVAADGHSWPYLVAMAGSTALYGFTGLLLSFALARNFVEERWAFWATIGIWFGSSVPLYFYVLPSWSHVHSVFATSLFLWYWQRTIGKRTAWQWLKLGLLSGLMIDVYFINGVFMLAVIYEVFSASAAAWSVGAARQEMLVKIFRQNLLCGLGLLLGLLPTFITRQIVFGGPFNVGPYALRSWNWTSPVFSLVLFSKSHGLFVVTPILILATAGLFNLRRLDRAFGTICMLITLVFYVLVSCFPWWYGAIGLGNRLFVSLTPIFVCGLASGFA